MDATLLQTTKEELAENLASFLVQKDYYPSDIGDPTCPLCLGYTDYRALTDEEIAEAWKTAAAKYNEIWSGDADPEAPCWREIGCQEDWRDLKAKRLEPDPPRPVLQPKASSVPKGCENLAAVHRSFRDPEGNEVFRVTVAYNGRASFTPISRTEDATPERFELLACLYQVAADWVRDIQRNGVGAAAEE